MFARLNIRNHAVQLPGKVIDTIGLHSNLLLSVSEGLLPACY